VLFRYNFWCRNQGRKCDGILKCEVSCLTSGRVIVHCFWTPGRRRAEYKCKSRPGVWTSKGRHRCTSWAAWSVIQSHAQRPSLYRRSVLDFGDISDLHPHHRSVCMDKETSTSGTSPITSASVGRVDISSPDFTYLQTARVWVTGPTGLSKLTRCVLGCGSQCSFSARSVIDELQLEVIDQRDLSVTVFETCPTAPGRRRFVRFNMRGTWTNASIVK